MDFMTFARPDVDGTQPTSSARLGSSAKSWRDACVCRAVKALSGLRKAGLPCEVAWCIPILEGYREG